MWESKSPMETSSKGEKRSCNWISIQPVFSSLKERGKLPNLNEKNDKVGYTQLYLDLWFSE